MRHHLRVNTGTGRALMIVLALLTLGVGFCLFDDDEGDHHGVSVDLCLALALFSSAVVVLAFTLVQLLPADRRAPVYAASLRRLDPPPRHLPLF
jgi:hypothetical protein